jgi:hypothetical protein
MIKKWDEQDWMTLLLSVKRRKCTPFLGAGASYDLIPPGAELAKRWADDFGYPSPSIFMPAIEPVTKRRSAPDIASQRAIARACKQRARFWLQRAMRI